VVKTGQAAIRLPRLPFAYFLPIALIIIVWHLVYLW
jgi:hypothetical protein